MGIQYPGPKHSLLVHISGGNSPRLRSSGAVPPQMLKYTPIVNGNFLFPLPPRSRRKSDTDLRTSTGLNMTQDPTFGRRQFLRSLMITRPRSTSVISSPLINTVAWFTPNNRSATLGHHKLPFILHTTLTSVDPTNFLSPDSGAPSFAGSKSDGGLRDQGNQRQSRSEDIYHKATPMLYPPSSQQDFINRQFLHPQESITGDCSRPHAGAHSSGVTRGGLVEQRFVFPRPSHTQAHRLSPRYRVDEVCRVVATGSSGRQGRPLPAT